MSDKPAMAETQTSERLGMLLVISGPAGVGKDTVWQAASVCLPTFTKATTCTTRPPRPGEQHGVHYFFVSEEEFDRWVEQNQLLEWAYVHNHRYGVPAASVLDRLTQGQDVVCVIDVQGALTIRSLFPNALLIFLKPPGGETDVLNVLKQRLRERGAANEEEVAQRLSRAQWELAQTQFYDYEIINDQVESAARRLCEIVAQEKQKRQEV